MNKGTIFFHKKFEFKDGEVGEKLLIVLNEPKKSESYLFCKTTSRSKFNLEHQGCYSDKNIYVIDADHDFFHKKTWVQFHEFYEANATDLLKAHFKGDLVVKAQLRIETINALVNCVKRSDDISKYYLSLL